MDLFGISQKSQFDGQYTYHFSPAFIFLLKFQMSRYLECNTMEIDFELVWSTTSYSGCLRHNIPTHHLNNFFQPSQESLSWTIMFKSQASHMHVQ